MLVAMETKQEPSAVWSQADSNNTAQVYNPDKTFLNLPDYSQNIIICFGKYSLNLMY